LIGCQGRPHVFRDVVGHGSSDRDHGGSEARVGSEDPVVAVSVYARGWDEPSQALEQLEGSEAKRLATVHIGLREPVDQTGLQRGERSDAGRGVKPLTGERPPG